MFQRFPNCQYTIRILLWDDNTSLVKCRHGSVDEDGFCDKIHISTYYNNKLTFDIIDIKHVNGVMMDETGKTYYPRELNKNN